jgi:hypothetical protein
MTDQTKPFAWDVYFVGADKDGGYREHFRVESDEAAKLALGRENTLKYLMERGAQSDVFDKSTPKPLPTTSKLAKFSQDGPPIVRRVEEKTVSSAEPETSAETIERLEKMGMLTPAQSIEIKSAVGINPTEPVSDTLKPSKLAKYAKIEKQ